MAVLDRPYLKRADEDYAPWLRRMKKRGMVKADGRGNFVRVIKQDDIDQEEEELREEEDEAEDE